MGEGISKPFINFGDFGPAANTLVTKVSDAVGGIFKPAQIRRIANAEAEADIIKAKSKIEITDLNRRAMIRFIEEQSKKQDNMEQITLQALPLLEESANPELIENDWITNFFVKCRLISDKEMQLLWSKVLAGEANNPGNYSKRTVNSLSNFDKSDAKLFQQLCGYGWQIDDYFPLITDVNNEVFNRNNINFMTLCHLESIGLIRFNSTAGFAELELPKLVTALYFDESVELELPKDYDNTLEIGHVLFTQIGKELAPLSGCLPVDGFKQYILKEWQLAKYIK